MNQELLTSTLIANYLSPAFNTTTTTSVLADNIMVEMPYNILSNYQLQADGSIAASIKNEYLY